jgi:cupin fold WbuC family metalloprotein
MAEPAPFPQLPGGVRLLDASVLEAASAEARRRPRLRANLNLHAMDEAVHRLLNAIEPGSWVRPHRHGTPPKAETLVVVRGSLGLVLFDEAGAVTATRLLRADPAGSFGAEIPAGAIHTFVALEPGTVFFEVKEGPYVAPAGEDLPGWAPAEGAEGAAAYEEALRALFPAGSR